MEVSSTEHSQSAESNLADDSIALGFSGGGLRATLFELGALLYLSRINRLKDVSGIVSVSGGSILAAHIATRWNEAKSSVQGMEKAASELIRFTQSDIRNSAFINWIKRRFVVIAIFANAFILIAAVTGVLWAVVVIVAAALVFYLCLPRLSIRFPSLSPTYFLRKEYSRHFKDQTIESIPTDAPPFAFAATDIKKHQRVAFLQQGIYRLAFDGRQEGDRIESKGTELSLAVAASSCFPPVFPKMYITGRDLDLNFEEFNETLNLMDGGVAGNLGIEMLLHLGPIPEPKIG
jgi:predicted acylesterase/phospholipase RssA